MTHPSVPTTYDLGLLLIEGRVAYDSKYITEDTGIIWQLNRNQGWIPVSRVAKKKKNEPILPQTFDGHKDFNKFAKTDTTAVPARYSDNPLAEDAEVQTFDGHKDFDKHDRIDTIDVPARYSDNPIAEEDGEESHTITLDRLQNILNKGGMTDDMIAGGMEISRLGLQKIGQQMGITAKEAKALYYSLITKVRTDSESIEETFKVLMDEPEEDGSYNSEINGDVGTYNFPWKVDGAIGTATVEYSGSPAAPKLKLISVRDSSGDEIDDLSNMAPEIKKQAIEFIGKA